MTQRFLVVILVSAIGLTMTEAYSAISKADRAQDLRSDHLFQETAPVYRLVAQNSKSARKRRLSAEGKVRKTGDKTVIDFDSMDISGERRTPLGSMINQNQADKAYDFVKIRMRWHPEMKKSAASLDTAP